MQLRLIDDLPFVTITVSYQGATVEISNVLVDTGSASSILSADIVSLIQIFPSPNDVLYTIRGVGGREVVFSRKVDFLQINDMRVFDFEVEIGGMDYGFDIFGILGMDFLSATGAIIDLHQLELRFQGFSSFSP